MNKRNFLVAALLIPLLVNPRSAKAETADIPRLIVLPFENQTGKKTQQHLSLGLTILVAEKLEKETGFAVVNGPLVLTADQISLTRQGASSWETQAVAYAASQNIALILTGSFSGPDVEHWTLDVILYSVQNGTLIKVGSGHAAGTQIVTFRGKTGKKLSVVSMEHIQGMLAAAVIEAFDDAGIKLVPATVQALNDLPTKDAYAYILYSRALAKVFLEKPVKNPAIKIGDGPPAKDDDSTALGTAEHAVRVDPKFEEARRLYAWLLADSGTPKSLEKARLHYEEALKIRPDDFRALIALGRLETQAKNYDAAKGLLTRAADAKAAEADPHYWLGKTLLGLEDRDGARTQFETARNLSGTHLDARRELVLIYTAARRYAEAARELEAVTTHAPKDLDAAFRLAACYRAADLLKEAAGAYAKAAERFPKEARFAKFLGDILMALGDPQAARKAYETAFTLAPNDPRIDAILGIKAEAPPNAKTLPAATLPLGGLALVKEVATGADALALTEGLRPQFQDAANNAVALAALGKDKCAEARASGKLARLVLASYAADGQTLAVSAAALKASLAAGEGAALTPDELSSATGTVAYAANALRDWREMLSLYVRSVKPSLAKTPCKDWEQLPIPSIAAIRARNLNHVVEMPDIKPPRWRPPASPDVPSDPVRIITFAVTNRSARLFSLTLDQEKERPLVVQPGERRTFTARIGFHQLCLVPVGTVCDQMSIRNVALHEGWETIIQPGKP